MQTSNWTNPSKTNVIVYEYQTKETQQITKGETRTEAKTNTEAETRTEAKTYKTHNNQSTHRPHGQTSNSRFNMGVYSNFPTHSSIVYLLLIDNLHFAQTGKRLFIVVSPPFDSGILCPTCWVNGVIWLCTIRYNIYLKTLKRIS
jgi:hypothetical protein